MKVTATPELMGEGGGGSSVSRNCIALPKRSKRIILLSIRKLIEYTLKHYLPDKMLLFSSTSLIKIYIHDLHDCIFVYL